MKYKAMIGYEFPELTKARANSNRTLYLKGEVRVEVDASGNIAPCIYSPDTPDQFYKFHSTPPLHFCTSPRRHVTFLHTQCKKLAVAHQMGQVWLGNKG